MSVLQSLGNILDDVVSVISPEQAVKRKSWRYAYNGYEAASLTRKDLALGGDGRADQIDSLSRDVIRTRARNVERNSDIVAGILFALENNVVGAKINMQAASSDEAFNERIEELFNEWQHAENCDVTGTQSLTEILKTILRRHLVDGGIMVNYCYSKYYKCGIQLQLREVDDLIDDNIPELENGNALVNGVEMTSYGKPIAYHLRKYKPNGLDDIESERIDAMRVDFLWNKYRPTQFREMSNLAQSVVRIDDLNDYNEAIAFQQKTAACTSAFIETENYTTTPGRIVNNNDGTKLTDLQAGTIKYLKPGEKFKPFIPTGQAAEAESYIITLLRMICAGQGLSLESGTRNVERVNYSSARQNMLADQQTYKALREFFIEHFLRKMYVRFVESCYFKGLLNETSYKFGDADFYKVRWLTEGLPWIDPLKEAEANNVLLSNGGLSFQKYCADHGTDWREQLQLMKEAQDYADMLGVKLAYIEKDDIVEEGDEGGENAKKSSNKSGKH